MISYREWWEASSYWRLLCHAKRHGGFSTGLVKATFSGKKTKAFNLFRAANKSFGKFFSPNKRFGNWNQRHFGKKKTRKLCRIIHLRFENMEEILNLFFLDLSKFKSEIINMIVDVLSFDELYFIRSLETRSINLRCRRILLRDITNREIIENSYSRTRYLMGREKCFKCLCRVSHWRAQDFAFYVCCQS